MRNGKNVTQQIQKYNYKNWKDAANDQYQDHNYGNWKDPSATGKLIISRIDLVKNKKGGLEDSLVITNQCPSEIDLVKMFGDNINFIYISPPWYINIFDCQGYVKLRHIKKLPLGIDKYNAYKSGSIQLRGFVFIWIPLYYFTAIHKIMEDKGYSYCDMVSASKTNLNGAFDTRSYSERNIGPIGRVGGITIHGCLFKQVIAKGSTKPRFIIGNQIMTDTIEHNWTFDEQTGQILYPDGHAYQLYDYLICDKIFNSKNNSALHLWSRRRCLHQGMAGVYCPGPLSKTSMMNIPKVWKGKIPTISFKEFEK